MTKKVGHIIDYKKERVVLSDILPYEIPPFFSNRYFYHFLVKNKVSIDEESKQIIFSRKDTNVIRNLIRILFGIDKSILSQQNNEFEYFKIDYKNFQTIPFKFKISHKDNDYRELTIIHPINQLRLVDFYDKYKYTILYNTKISRFSLRRPHKVSSLKYFKDSTNKSKKSANQEVEIIETSDKEYTSLKTYFSYQKYSNIYQFYESYEFQRAEKRFDNLLKFDISRCFDSIYTHSLSWVLNNKKIVKDNLNEYNNSFGGKFDKIMQQMNYNETNGIVIGPEFSRIFAELILQKIDKNVEKELYKKGYRYKVDYDIYRYVDDFFVFYNDEKVKGDILALYKVKLQEYNLFFNDSKTQIFSKPIITNITIAKEEIRKLVEYSMIFQFQNSENQSQVGLKYYTARDIITNYKAILSQTQTSYKDLQNYFLVIIFNKLKKMIKDIQKMQEELLTLYSERTQAKQEEKKEEILEKIKIKEKELKTIYFQIYKNFMGIIELSFFIYSVLPRVAYSIKICQILFRIIDFIKSQEKTKQKYSTKYSKDEMKYIAFGFDKKHTIFKSIYDNISLVFQKNTSSEYTEVETLYLLTIISELGKNYQFSEDLINKNFRVFDIEENSNSNLNYFTILSLLNYIKRDNKFNNIRNHLRKIITKKFDNFVPNDAESVFLLIDVLTCPYIESSDDKLIEFRRKILNKIQFWNENTPKTDRYKDLKDLSKYSSNWFYSWKNNDLGKELNTKRGHSVY
jgi:hypothetical protein